MSNTLNTALHDQNLYRIACAYRNGEREERFSQLIFAMNADNVLTLAHDPKTTLRKYLQRRALIPNAELQIRGVELVKKGRN